MKRIQFLFAAVAALFIATASAPAAELALDGYCPVCYIEAGKAVKGEKSFAADHAGKTYYFVSDETKALFVANPAKYLPVYDGWCAYGMAFGKKFESDPRVFTVVNGKIYLNKNKKIGKKFNKDKSGFIAKADAAWKSEMKK